MPGNVAKFVIVRSLDKGVKSVQDVSAYAGNITKKLDELKKCLPEQVKRIQDAIKALFGRLARIHQLEMKAKELMNHRLNELISESETVCARLKDGAALTVGDIENLKGCLESWKKSKRESFDEEKRRKEETRRRKEEEKKRRREEDEKRKQEEEERRRQEEKERKRHKEEERKRREEEERQRKEEEERQRREEKGRKQVEEERTRQEEEERKRRKEEERRRREEEERQRKEDEERQRRQEEERIKLNKEKLEREIELQMRNAEARERERRRKEEEERAKRKDPNNWEPIVYNRPCDEVRGKKAFHSGVCCMITAPPGDITREDVECNACDDLDDVIKILDDGEKPASSIINIESKKGLVKSECLSRVYIPHCPVNSSSDELVLKVSVNGSEWETAEVVSPTQAMSENKVSLILQFPVSNLVGIELSEFENIKIMVIARPRGQTVIVDKPGLNFNSITDKNVKLFLPRDAFPSRTEVRLVVNSISPETIAQNAKDDSLWENVMSTSSMISIFCRRAPTKEIEVDITHQTTSSGGRSSRGKLYHMFSTRDKVWKFADLEYKGTKDVVSVTLPAYKDRFSLFELEMPANIPKETALKVAQSCHEQMFKSPVRIIVRQHDVDPQKALVMVAGSKHVRSFIDQMKDDGYSYGPDVTKQFGLKDGQRLILTCAGNIDTSSGKNGVVYMNSKIHCNFINLLIVGNDKQNMTRLKQKSYRNAILFLTQVNMTFYTYMYLIKEPLKLHVVDMYRQKDLQEYRGIIRLTVDNGTEVPDEQLDLTVTLPKIERQKTLFQGTRVRFPYYLTALAGFLSRQIFEHDELSWKDVLLAIVGKRDLESLIRVAKRKCDDNDVTSVCTVTLCNWMKATSRNDDKVYHILVALDCDGFHELHNKCSAFVQFQKEVMTDTSLSEISSTTSKSAYELAVDLNLDQEAVDRCKKEYGQDNLVNHLLYEWRESDEAIKYGDRALDRLRTLCGV
ncbi:uncharacterized protein LOC128219222 [Mya arenaria]|uniref:uncharacterized protein LOC128219222 n=1 Tax=Mya arenaria TaxID=6604 RepID=UPI0022DF1A64|nr:uncharacterized protein LOC128219222 [Mya arenaria]